MSRPSADEYFLSIAMVVATRASCARRRVGCVVVDRHNHILATGYNGPGSGMRHCTDDPCPGALLPSGTGLDVCEAIHAEQNALIQCQRVQEIETVYCTTAPCVTCIKMIMNTGAKRIVFKDTYPHAEASEKLWTQRGGVWHHFQIPDPSQFHPLFLMTEAVLGEYVKVSKSKLASAQDKVTEQNISERGPTPSVRARLDVGTTEARRLARLQRTRPDRV